MRIAILPYWIETLPLMKGFLKALTQAGHTVELFIGHYNADYNDYLEGYKYTMCNWAEFDMREIGCFNPDRIIVWNGFSPVTIAAYQHLAKRFDTLTVERAWLPQKFNNYISDGLAAHSMIRDIVDKYCSIPMTNSGVVVPPIGALDERLPNRYIFIPAQLDHDTSITISSPYFKTMDSLIGFIRYIVGNEMPIVVKNHPLEPDTPRNKGVLLYKGAMTTNDLMAHAQVVVGLTSTCLVECLQYHNRIMSFGYNVAMRAHAYNNVMCPVNVISVGQELYDLWATDKKSDDPLRVRCMTTLQQLQWDRITTPNWVIKYIEEPKRTRRTIMEAQISS